MDVLTVTLLRIACHVLIGHHDKRIIRPESIKGGTIVGGHATAADRTNHESGKANGAHGTGDIVLGTRQTGHADAAQDHFGTGAKLGRDHQTNVTAKATNLA